MPPSTGSRTCSSGTSGAPSTLARCSPRLLTADHPGLAATGPSKRYPATGVELDERAAPAAVADRRRPGTLGQSCLDDRRSTGDRAPRFPRLLVEAITAAPPLAQSHRARLRCGCITGLIAAGRLHRARHGFRRLLTEMAGAWPACTPMITSRLPAIADAPGSTRSTPRTCGRCTPGRTPSVPLRGGDRGLRLAATPLVASTTAVVDEIISLTHRRDGRLAGTAAASVVPCLLGVPGWSLVPADLVTATARGWTRCARYPVLLLLARIWADDHGHAPASSSAGSAGHSPGLAHARLLRVGGCFWWVIWLVYALCACSPRQTARGIAARGVGLGLLVPTVLAPCRDDRWRCRAVKLAHDCAPTVVAMVAFLRRSGWLGVVAWSHVPPAALWRAGRYQ